MNRFKRCYDNNGHRWEIVINHIESDVTRFSGYLRCADCDAVTEDFIDKEVGINDESIIEIIATEDEKILVDIDAGIL